jgi:hypothetical protein
MNLELPMLASILTETSHSSCPSFAEAEPNFQPGDAVLAKIGAHCLERT